jgi:hypothetical protein
MAPSAAIFTSLDAWTDHLAPSRFGAGETITLHYRLRAKYPIRARTFQSRVYEYYDTEVKSVAAPVAMEVRKR